MVSQCFSQISRLSRFRSFWLLVLLLLIVACGNAKPLPALQATILDAYTGNPVANATITTTTDTGGETGYTTNAQGKVVVESWSRDATLTIRADGYEPQQIAVTSVPHLADVTSESTDVTADFQLRPNTLSGTITNAYTDEPVADALLTVNASVPQPQSDQQTEMTNGATTPITATVGRDGSYILANLPESFTLQVQAPDYKPLETAISRETTQQIALRPSILTGVVTNRYNNEPLDGASVVLATDATTLTNTVMTSGDGHYTLHDIPDGPYRVAFSADGFAPITRTVEQSATLDAALRPDRLTATLTDQETGEVIPFATIIATMSMTSTAVAMERIRNSTDGEFTLEGLPETGYIQVLAPGYRKAVHELAPGSFPTSIELEPLFVKSLYIKCTTIAYMPGVLVEFFDTIDSTELNAIVIDLKSDNISDLGLIYYDSQVPIIQELGTSADWMDIGAILEEARSRNIYTIARIHIFSHDNLLAETMPAWAAQDKNGCEPNDNRKCNGDIFYADWDIAWLDPWNRNVWDYNIQLGVEAALLGFDEIQFDYIRFASDAKNLKDMVLSKPIDPANNPEPMYENIATFMEQAHEAINAAGAFFSADVFGYASWAPQPTIGQNVSLMAEHADYIYPMVYPSHYYVNELGFENAAAHPYEIVYESLKHGHNMMAGKWAKQRPWLQDFTLLWVPDEYIVEYGAAEVRAQIDATETFTGTAGWALWNSDNEYTFEAIKPE
jgi:hypothetical protein